MTEPVKKLRKETDGAIRNKARTRLKMINAVGTVIKKKGYAGLNAKNIIVEAGVDRKLITLYFGGLDGLIDEYLRSRDYWMTKVGPVVAELLSNTPQPGQSETYKVLELFYDELKSSDDLRAILSLEVSQSHPRLRELSNSREKLGSQLFDLIAAKFTNTDININAVMGLLIAGVYYMQLHAHINGSTFCNLSILEPQGENAVKASLSKILSLVFEDAARQQAQPHS
jgi:AcrR family transcriptional regulator